MISFKKIQEEIIKYFYCFSRCSILSVFKDRYDSFLVKSFDCPFSFLVCLILTHREGFDF